jgi:hypothetical protein
MACIFLFMAISVANGLVRYLPQVLENRGWLLLSAVNLLFTVPVGVGLLRAPNKTPREVDTRLTQLGRLPMAITDRRLTRALMGSPTRDRLKNQKAGRRSLSQNLF